MENEANVSAVSIRSHVGAIVLVIVLVVIALLLWQGTKRSGQSDYEKAMNVPAENQGQVSAEEQANIDMLRKAPASTQ